jgi:membrane protein DedA with SNARE-associated domain
VLFGHALPTGLQGYVVMALAGTLGYLLGSVAGWAVGRSGGRSLLERHGRWLHLSPQSLERAERWFARYGAWAVFLGRLTPVVRSFISIPAGALGSPIGPYTVLTLAGSAIWCFGFAGAGWALGTGYERLHGAFHSVDLLAIGLAAAAVAAAFVLHRRWRVEA